MFTHLLAVLSLLAIGIFLLLLAYSLRQQNHRPAALISLLFGLLLMIVPLAQHLVSFAPAAFPTHPKPKSLPLSPTHQVTKPRHNHTNSSFYYVDASHHKWMQGSYVLPSDAQGRRTIKLTGLHHATITLREDPKAKRHGNGQQFTSRKVHVAPGKTTKVTVNIDKKKDDLELQAVDPFGKKTSIWISNWSDDYLNKDDN